MPPGKVEGKRAQLLDESQEKVEGNIVLHLNVKANVNEKASKNAE